MSSQTVTLNDTIGVSDTTKVTTPSIHRSFADVVGITDSVIRRGGRFPVSNIVGLTSAVTVVFHGVPFDTWRPIPRPDNQLVVACRTPLGEHDSPTGLTHIRLWSFHNDGSHEHVEWQNPAANGWVSYGHPEWSPDGTKIILWTETSTQFQIVVLDATGWGA